MKIRVIIRVEIVKRELRAKLLLAMYLSRNNYDVIITTRLFNNTHILKRNDIVIINSAYENMFDILVDVKKRVGKLIFLDEKSLVIRSKAEYLKRIPLKCINLFDAVLCIGKYQKEILDSHLKNSSNNFLMGNPRLNILSKRYNYIRKKNKNAIRELYGRYILIVSNFGSVNLWGSPVDKKSRFVFKKNIFETQGILSDLKDFEKRFSHFEKIFQAFKELIPGMANRFDKIVIRVHPSENSKIWHEIVSNFDNVVINQEFDLSDLIYYSECVIQNGCTSALEAYLLRKPCFSYRPLVNQEYDFLFPTYISENVYNSDTLFAKVENCISYVNYKSCINFKIDNFITNYEDDDFFLAFVKFLKQLKITNSSEKIIDFNFKRILDNFFFSYQKTW